MGGNKQSGLLGSCVCGSVRAVPGKLPILSIALQNVPKNLNYSCLDLVGIETTWVYL